MYSRCYFSFPDGPLQISSSTCQSPGRHHPCLADPILSQLRDRCQYLGIAPSTRRVYQSGIKALYSFNFCEKFKIQPLPVASLTLQFFCVDVSSHASYKTLKVYLAAIRLLHLEHGLDDPTNDHLLHLVCRGIRRLQGDHTRPRLPITINLLRTLKTQLSKSTSFTLLEQRLLWAAFSLAFYGFMRVSEFTTPAVSDNFSPPGLHWTDVKLHTNSISLTLHQSKTDPFQQGHQITIAATNTSTCPVRAMHKYVSVVPARDRTGPLFSVGRFSPLSRVNVTATLRQLLHNTNVMPSSYASHSFRIGAATTATAAGLTPTLIKTLGRWRSNAYETYVQYPPSSIGAVSSIFAHTDASTQFAWNPDGHDHTP